MKFRIFSVCLSAALVVAAAGCSGSSSTDDTATVGSKDSTAPLYDSLPAAIKDKGTITVGSQLSSPPIVSLKDDGKTISGVNVDLAEKLSKELGVRIEFEQISFASLTPALQSGKIDAVFDMMSDTAERQQTFDFVDFIHNGLTYLVAEGNPDGVRAVADLCGKSVAGVRGTSLVSYAEAASKTCTSNGAKPIQVRQFDDAGDARLQVQTGKSTAFLGQTPIMLYMADNAEGGKAFDAVIDEAYPVETIGIAVDKSNVELRDTLQQAVQAIIDSGDYAKVLADYGLDKLAMKSASVNAGA